LILTITSTGGGDCWNALYSGGLHAKEAAKASTAKADVAKYGMSRMAFPHRYTINYTKNAEG
jgi:hypothetical protein